MYIYIYHLLALEFILAVNISDLYRLYNPSFTYLHVYLPRPLCLPYTLIIRIYPHNIYFVHMLIFNRL